MENKIGWLRNEPDRNHGRKKEGLKENRSIDFTSYATNGVESLRWKLYFQFSTFRLCLGV